MITVTFLYPNQEGGRFDMEYYLNTHMPMSIEKLSPALKSVSVEQGVSGGAPGTKPTYLALCHLTFDSIEAFLAALQPHAEALQGDIPNYTDIEPVMQFSEVKISR